MKRNLIILIATLPILGIAWRLCSSGTQKPQVSAASKRTPVQSMTGQKSSEREDKQASQGNGASDRPSERELAQDQLTLKYLDHAQEASKLKPSDFGKNGDFLLKKHQALFDSWGLNGTERSQFVGILTEKGVRMAEIAVESAKTWPLEVGHVANRKLGTEHAKKQFESYQKVEADAKSKLTALVGAERVAEFEKQQKGGAAQAKD